MTDAERAALVEQTVTWILAIPRPNHATVWAQVQLIANTLDAERAEAIKLLTETHATAERLLGDDLAHALDAMRRARALLPEGTDAASVLNEALAAAARGDCCPEVMG